MFGRWTDRARKVMALANQEAQRFNHEYIGTEHILLGLIKEGSGTGAMIIKKLGVDRRKIFLEIEKLVKSGPETVTMGKLPQTPRAKKVIEFAIEEARNLNHDFIGTEHLLLGLMREQDGVAAHVLMNLSLRLEDLREEVLNEASKAADNRSEKSEIIGGIEPDDSNPNTVKCCIWIDDRQIRVTAHCLRCLLDATDQTTGQLDEWFLGHLLIGIEEVKSEDSKRITKKIKTRRKTPIKKKRTPTKER